MTVEERPDVPGTYRVVYHIDLRDPFAPSCDCRAGCLTDKTCRHVKACQAYRDGEPIPE